MRKSTHQAAASCHKWLKNDLKNQPPIADSLNSYNCHVTVGNYTNIWADTETSGTTLRTDTETSEWRVTSNNTLTSELTLREVSGQ